ncbi:TetR/AcrR family transcriptional regulator [uncultured Jannaschia sp.]|uniref:TetR/AcrR family transcriptional regulator n=1 Tax=uncultured Jannaschia sp. TaxID=293347 RepID=UPI0026381A26|nr:TetR/AcrR family transcriptional regulator [uncultured Jannaschia sp.]
MNDVTPIKKGRKFDQVIEGARSVFLSDGYEGASVDAIARAAGVSKATLYSYFTDKKLLFMEVAKAECSTQICEAGEILTPGSEPRDALCEAGYQMTRFVLSDFGQSIFRMCVAESDRFPELGREFFRTGPQVFREQMRAYLRLAVEREELVIDDIELAADQFVELCHATLFVEMVFGVRETATDAEVDRIVSGAVDTFMARFGA